MSTPRFELLLTFPLKCHTSINKTWVVIIMEKFFDNIKPWNISTFFLVGYLCFLSTRNTNDRSAFLQNSLSLSCHCFTTSNNVSTCLLWLAEVVPGTNYWMFWKPFDRKTIFFYEAVLVHVLPACKGYVKFTSTGVSCWLFKYK